MLQTLETITVWDQLQEPRCYTSTSQGYLRLLSALDSGWTIVAILELLPVQRLSESETFRIDMTNPASGERQSLFVPYCPELAQVMMNEQFSCPIGSHPFFYGS